jgi:acetyl-CoA decarbonylase/synthase, CODH/ACS complex subunit gamma
MALTGMQIYKSLPKTNCKDCGLPTCMAFAMQVAAKQRALEDCPHVSEEASGSLAESSAPPMKLITIGSPERKFEFGQETVMFRHEDKFHRGTGIAVRFDQGMTDVDVDEKLKAVNSSVFMRVGERLYVKFCAVEVDGLDDPAARMKKIIDAGCLPAIVIGSDPEKVKAAASAVKDEKPLIYRADSSNIDAMAAVAKELGTSLAVFAPTLEELADLTQKAKDAGVEDLVLSFDCEKLGETVRTMTIARRAALKKQFRPFGYPSIVDIKTDNPELETVFAATCAAKYAGIVIVDGVEPWQVLPVLTMVQDVYTDPQVPNTVETKLYEIGNPDENSPVLFTTNFSLTYFSVEGEVERSKVPSYICVVDTEGLGVLNAYAGDKISAEKVIKALQDQGVADKVKHRKLIIPGLLPIFRAEIEETSEWSEVIIGPESAGGIPAFLSSNWG